MARKREALKHLDYNSKEYWNRLLAEDGLSVDQGKSKKLLYIGGANEVENLEGSLRTDTGRTPPADTGDRQHEDKG